MVKHKAFLTYISTILDNKDWNNNTMSKREQQSVSVARTHFLWIINEQKCLYLALLFRPYHICNLVMTLVWSHRCRNYRIAGLFRGRTFSQISHVRNRPRKYFPRNFIIILILLGPPWGRSAEYLLLPVTTQLIAPPLCKNTRNEMWNMSKNRFSFQDWGSCGLPASRLHCKLSPTDANQTSL